MFNNTVILIHGYTLTANKTFSNAELLPHRSWQHVAWGEINTQQMGRIPTGIFLALKYRASRIFLGSGASCIYSGNPLSRNECKKKSAVNHITWEADFTFNYIIDNFTDLSKFKTLNRAIHDFGGIKKAREYIRKISVIDNRSKNSSAELHNALTKYQYPADTGFIYVTSASHLPRCTAISINCIRTFDLNGISIIPFPADTDFSNGDKPLIFEPLSGSSALNSPNACKILGDYFTLSENRKIVFLEYAKRFFAKPI